MLANQRISQACLFGTSVFTRPVLSMTSPSILPLTNREFAWRPKQIPLKRWNIVTGDMVEVISGRYKKQQGKVKKVVRQKNQVVVQGINMKFKVVTDDENMRRKKTVQSEHPIHVSNV